MVTYRQAPFLEQAVRSCYTQTYSPIEVWISDDASPDETPAVVQRLREEFPDINYHRHSANLGMVRNYDWILRQPKTEYIAMLDSDDLLAPRFVERMASLLDKYPQAGYAHAALQYIDAQRRILKESRLARLREYLSPDEALAGMTMGQKANPSLRLFRRKALGKVDFFRGRPANVQDYDLGVSIADAGYGNVYSSELLGYYRVWGSMQWTFERTLERAAGLTHIYDRTLAPAFRRRGWSAGSLNRARRKQAAGMIPALQDFPPDGPERQRLTSLLLALSPTWQTRARIRFVDYMPHKAISALRAPLQRMKRAMKDLLFAK